MSQSEWKPLGPIGLIVVAWRADSVSTVAMLILAMVFGTAISTGLAALLLRVSEI